MNISVVIPCYNAAKWLPETLNKASLALQNGGVAEAEIVLVDDGSVDGSAYIAEGLKLPYPIRVVRQANKGRFLARKAGLEAANYDYILFLDTRVHLSEDSLKFVLNQLKKHTDRKIWNGHVYVYKKGNIIARFMDAVTFVGWRRYFGNPRTTSYGLEDFDYYPKGTGCFLAPKNIVVHAIQEFESENRDLRFSSDDTHLIRIMAKENRINLSPEFSCTYFARNTFRAFIKHTYHRGQFFVDGFLRRGTRFFWPLIIFYITTLVMVLLIILHPSYLLWLLVAAAFIWFIELIIAVMLGLKLNDAFSLFLLTPVFAFTYGAGIWRALVRRAI